MEYQDFVVNFLYNEEHLVIDDFSSFLRVLGLVMHKERRKDTLSHICYIIVLLKNLCY